MLDGIRKLFGIRSAAESRRENPQLVSTAKKSSEIYGQTPLSNLISRGSIDRLAREYYLEINAVCNSPDSVTAGRDRLAAAMLRFALYQVLVIPSPPDDDTSGLRGLPGVSGELSPYQANLAKKDIALRAALHESEHHSDSKSARELLEVEYWKSYWLVETLNVARLEIGDTVADDDWYFPFKHASCANQENIYRIDLQLPSAFDDDLARTAPTAYSILTDIVVSGAGDPMMEWRDYHAGQPVPAPGTRS